MNLQRSEVVKFSLGLDIGGVGLFRRPERAEVTLRAVDPDVCSPPLVVSLSADQAGSAISARSPEVLHVAGLRDISEVFDSVVGRIAVNVVNHAGRPMPVVHCPRDSVSANLDPVERYQNAPVASGAPCNCPDGSPVAGADLPSKNASLWVICERFTQAFDRHLSHPMSFINGLIAGGRGRMAMKHLFAR